VFFTLRRNWSFYELFTESFFLQKWFFYGITPFKTLLRVYSIRFCVKKVWKDSWVKDSIL